MVRVFDAQAAVTPPGKPVAVPMPVAPVVVRVILLNGVLIHRVGVLDAALAVMAGVTVMVAVAPVIAVVLIHPFEPVIDVRVYAVLTTGFGFALNGVPLTIPV